MSGRTSYYAGAAAEDIVASDYARRGWPALNKRWRGSAGEVDLIVREGDCIVFVEVKKSRSFAQAATRLSRRQMDRIYGAASEYIANEPKGQLTDVRFDVALVNAQGAVQIIENAFMDA
ncbi:YraN family protein [Yoonia sp. R2331]|uniref:YraN family protein n=1 Tax=Yoonia sp. R2331 TaxID=3237238 RepID=UPI0034E47EE4